MEPKVIVSIVMLGPIVVVLWAFTIRVAYCIIVGKSPFPSKETQ